MTLGAEPKKLAILGGLVAVALVALYVNSSGDSSPTPTPTPTQHPSPDAAADVTPNKTTGPTRTAGRPAMAEIHPRVLGTRPDDLKNAPPDKIDPGLRLDLLANVVAVAPIEAGRNMFQFGAAPPPDKPIPAVPTNVQPIPITHPAPPPVVASNTPPAPPPAPPINLKYYGFKISKADGHRLAFLLDGDDIFLASENETVKQRYRIVRISQTSIDIEDTQAKSTQTLKITDIPT